MKRKATAVLITAALFASGAISAFAAAPNDAASGLGDVIQHMEFVGTPVNLSLSNAVARIKSTGPGVEMAALARDLNKTAALGQMEQWRDLRYVVSVHSSDAKLVNLSREYMSEQADIGYEIAMNQLEYNTISTYYGLLLAQEGLRISKENLQVQNDILANTDKKFSLGVASKLDVLSAQSGVEDAQVTVQSAETQLKNARMGLNQQLNYPIMQQIVLTDSLRQTTAPAITLEDAIKSAIANRNDLREAEFQLESAKLTLDGLAFTSKVTARYMNAQLGVTKAQLARDMKVSGIEMEIRGKYMKLQDLAAEIAAAKQKVDNAAETYRLAGLSYDAGMRTLVEVQGAQLVSFNAQLALSSKITEYDLAVFDFEYATGYGLSQAAAGGSAS
jgi:outer membrane protein TolC